MIYYDKRGWAKFYGLTHPLSYLGILNFNYMRMGKFFIAAVLCLLSALGLVSCAPTQSDDCDYLPQSPSASEDIYSINVEDLTEGMRLSVLSAQGLLNRDGAEVYTYVGQDAWLLDFYKERGYVKEVRDYDDPYRLLSDICGDGISGIVVYDPEKKFTINLATNIAGVEDRIIVHPDDLQKVSEATGLTDVIDLRDMGFIDVKESFRWYMDNVFPEQNHSVLSVAKSGVFMFDVYRDYLVEFRIPVFWLPGKSDADYDPDYERQVIEMFKATPENIPVLGFWPGVEDGKDIGYAEMDGVGLAGKYGKFTLVNTWVGNYSFHSGVKPHLKEYSQERVRRDTLEYDPQKKYVALIMAESGDAPAYYLYTGLYPRQWNDPDRGKVAISYGITPSLRMLAPAVLADLYETRTDNDYFFCSISGAGYCYPFLGYGSLTPDPDRCRSRYFLEMTADNMKMLDLDMLGIYTHPDIAWTQEDRQIAEKYIFPMPGLRSVVSGMHRTEYTAGNSHELHGDVSVHHNVTFWSMENFVWDDISIDEKAVDHLENEIRTYGADGNFIMAMFYSWHYGPRRLNMLRERLESEGYVFVTLDEFDRLWRQSQITTKTSS